MTFVRQSGIQNKLLRRFPEDAFDLLAPKLESIDLPVKHSLVLARKPIEHVCFIESGLASMVAESADGKSVEIRHIGREGIAGYPVLLGVDRTPNSVFMQVPGHGLQVATENFAPILEHAEVRKLLLRYVHTCELQLAHTALAAAKFNTHQRLSRWLLMCHDRLDGNDLALTHEFLALMLGVRRAGVTDELHILEGMHAIRSTRGNVRILDRDMLIEIAGGCYGVPEQEYDRLIGDRARRPVLPVHLNGNAHHRML
ncbi:Crp/Fnr family transcriptional regulator [Rhizobium leguminosarum]|uniref:Crp/Fnr family transcriptional regulator n=1 Tax=Rhizobium leguminosarum TaxID=384 RepID=UPI001C9487E2|nr:Crp/Fnr family transcriptional regulator [Rhizobium leguminosarum]MBY5520763.1 Crp/Fnr family transcriptional regulator [Rhizobium leguminosarum]MBY5544266.1 Crp/Fnr family transcriptional regulator [Rhizobium leguminosarum]MBY5701074.1 Crp/Fnr family transcriptional regulator [Rhizobium leguminosarum]MBY5748156.1 Crp/Fnr family transcriptional regulator [Rhizobium leguminosarum]